MEEAIGYWNQLISLDWYPMILGWIEWVGIWAFYMVLIQITLLMISGIFNKEETEVGSLSALISISSVLWAILIMVNFY